MNVLDLFSGIGGFSLGLERAGMRTVAFCEIDPFCRRVLAKHWPTVTCYGNVRTLTAARLRADGIVADVICGGFPCQDISSAGKGVGIEGERSGLWKEYARIIGELRPHYVIVENVAALLSRGLDVVLRDLASIRYDAEWNCIPASAAGAPHRRDRLWLVAYPDGSERGQISSTRQRLAWADCLSQWQEGPGGFGASGEALADAAWVQPGRQEQRPERKRTGARGKSHDGSDAEAAEWRRAGSAHDAGRWDQETRGLGFGRSGPEHWLVEPDVGRVAHGIPGRVDRLKGLGNAVVPQIPEIIGRAIMRACPHAAGDRTP